MTALKAVGNNLFYCEISSPCGLFRRQEGQFTRNPGKPLQYALFSNAL